MRFKVGDNVRIKDECVGNNYYDHLWFNEEMEKFKDKKLTIKNVYDNNYFIVENFYSYNDAILEPFEFKVGDEVVITNSICKNLIGKKGNIADTRKFKEILVCIGRNTLVKTSNECIKLIKDCNQINQINQEISQKISQVEMNVELGSNSIKNLRKILEGVEEKMEILNLYEKRKNKLIHDKYNKLKDKIKEEDEIQKILLDTENQINVLLDGDEEHRSYIHSDIVYTEQTLQRIEELDIERKKEFDELNTTIATLESLFDLTEDYDERIKILQKYNILDKNLKLILEDK